MLVADNSYDNESERAAILEAAELARGFVDFRRTALPLCAAENIMSTAVRIPLDSGLDERYIMGGIGNYTAENNFIGSSTLHPFYLCIRDLCESMFNAAYSDARPLTALNAMTSLLMAITESGMKIVISSADSGGHPSMRDVCHRLGLHMIEAPYNYYDFNYDMESLSSLLESQDIDFVILAPSDILQEPDWELLKIPSQTIVIYDATQSLGLIGAGIVPSPLRNNPNFILMGGTHKTLPGPPKGLIMVSNSELAERIDKSISPRFIRNTHMSHVASLHICLLEHRLWGKEYMTQMINNARFLASVLESDYGFEIAKLKTGEVTNTHQLFLLTSKTEMSSMFTNGVSFGITLNKKNKTLFRNAGIRLGLQEITRYGWNQEDLLDVAFLLNELRSQHYHEREIMKRLERLSRKRNEAYSFSHEAISDLRKAFSNLSPSDLASASSSIANST